MTATRRGPIRSTADGDRGDTLLELIITVTIIGVAFVAILGAVGTAIVMSDMHRKQAAAGAAVRSYAEALETRVGTSGLATCATLLSVYESPAVFSPPDGYEQTVTDPQSWDPDATNPDGTHGAWTTCTDAADLQRLNVTVSELDPISVPLQVVETVTVVLRRA